MNLNELFERFKREKIYLKNVTKKTLVFYECSFKALIRHLPGDSLDALSKQSLNEFVIKLREQGVQPVSINTYISGVNSFFTWLHENEYMETHFKIKKLKVEEKVIKTFTTAHLKQIVMYKPKTFAQRRLYATLCLIIDTGVRIEEALTLKRNMIDFDNMLVTVMGKGQKERTVPISLELRKTLYNFLKLHEREYVFPTSNGNRQLQRNFYKDMNNLCKKLGIEGVRISAHTLRHTFAKQYVKNGGNLFYLMKQLGHTNIKMSKRYVELDEADLSEMHLRTSLLSRLK
jgi:integrase/recombinase XerD